jgi:hypothetical protein
MHGNVAEWCSDQYGKNYYQNSPRKDPKGPDDGAGRVIRGGGWSGHGTNCRSAERWYYTPRFSFNYVGFRVAARLRRGDEGRAERSEVKPETIQKKVRAGSEKEVVAAILKLGGKVTLATTADRSVVGVDLGRTRVTDADLKQIAALKHLEMLWLMHTKVTDKGLKELAGLNQLKLLHLAGTLVTDKGMKEVARFENLQYLILTGAKVTDEGLKDLKGLDQLMTLDLYDTKVTPAGVAAAKRSLPLCKIRR